MPQIQPTPMSVQLAVSIKQCVQSYTSGSQVSWKGKFSSVNPRRPSHQQGDIPQLEGGTSRHSSDSIFLSFLPSFPHLNISQTNLKYIGVGGEGEGLGELFLTLSIHTYAK